MSLASQETLRVVLYEGPRARTLSNQERFETLSALLEGGYAVQSGRDPELLRVSDGHPTAVIGWFESNTPAVEPDASSPGSVRVINLSEQALAEAPRTVSQTGEALQAVRPGEWKPWFPVIDYDRCTNCMQCLSFCLFGVYGVDPNQRIQVQQSDQCKTNCPACSRVCPEAAIMFPKYKAGPINGDVVNASDLEREKMKIDISALLGGDIYQMLRDRSERARSRFSKERDSNKALNERQKCLTKLAQSGDIPPEVLMALPSPEEIQRRAAEAMARAQAARDPSAS